MRVSCIYTIEAPGAKPTAKPLATFSLLPFGLGYVATSLQKAGHAVRTLVLTSKAAWHEELLRHLREHEPGLICLTAVTSQYPLVCQVGALAHEHRPSAKSLLGGPHATLNPEATVVEPWLDALCVGEGEVAAARYAESLERGETPAAISNLWIKSQDGVERNLPAPFADVDALPFVDRSLWREWVEDPAEMPSVLLGRGCPNRCTYCCNHALAKVAPGRYVRHRNPESVLGELETLMLQEPSTRAVYLEVESFGTSRKYVEDLCGRLEQFNARRVPPLLFGTNIAVHKGICRDRTLLQRLRSAGFAFLNIGLESGSERIRKDILRRPRYSNGDIQEFCEMARQEGIKIALYVMIGLPTETPAEFAETVACARACRPEHVQLSIFYPYPGTDLHQTAREMGLFTGTIVDPERERRKPAIDLPGFGRRRLEREYALFPLRVYRGRRPFGGLAGAAVTAWLAFHPEYQRILRTALPERYLGALKRGLLRLTAQDRRLSQ